MTVGWPYNNWSAVNLQTSNTNRYRKIGFQNPRHLLSKSYPRRVGVHLTLGIGALRIHSMSGAPQRSRDLWEKHKPAERLGPAFIPNWKARGGKWKACSPPDEASCVSMTWEKSGDFPIGMEKGSPFPSVCGLLWGRGGGLGEQPVWCSG